MAMRFSHLVMVLSELIFICMVFLPLCIEVFFEVPDKLMCLQTQQTIG